ncbi:MAG: D-alanyl-D-alanine carboxypeptidase/D-alanyl-D-alanine-endopeptidase [Oligoflexia bacterium]|nr:D-alanyl-D-alanine carboxypeptidase/D-alanyl-D-alanine-endopeptidase [Oligoflexia bacterium]
MIFKICSYIYIVVTIIVNYFSPVFAASTSCNLSLSKIIHQYPYVQKYLGVYIVDLESSAGSTGRAEVFSLNPDQLFIPASLSKIVTTITALKKLGTNYLFKTEVKYRGTMGGAETLPDTSPGTLHGDLYLIGKGDPSLVSEKLQRIVDQLYFLGLRKVQGDIIIDDSFFAQTESLRDVSDYSEYEERSNGEHPYNALASALSFNFNSAAIHISTNPFTIHLDPVDTPYIKLTDAVELAATNTNSSKKKFDISVHQVKNNDVNEEFKIVGSRALLPVGANTDHRLITFYRPVGNPTLYTGHIFKSLLEKNQITVSGTVKKLSTPLTPKDLKELKDLYTHHSEDLSHIIALANRFSNNFMCEQLLLTMGAELFGAPGTPGKGLRVISDLLDSIAFKNKNYQIVNGSGLTYRNQLSPRQIIQLLEYAHRDLSIYPEFLHSLAMPGAPGTLERWFPGNTRMHVIRAKTGSLSQKMLIHAISGYTSTKSGRHLAFAIMINVPHHTKNAMHLFLQSKQIEEKILSALANLP